MGRSPPARVLLYQRVASMSCCPREQDAENRAGSTLAGGVDSDGRAGQAASPRLRRQGGPPASATAGTRIKPPPPFGGPGETIRVGRVRAFCRFDPRGDRRIAGGGGTRRPADPVRRARPGRLGPVSRLRRARRPRSRSGSSRPDPRRWAGTSPRGRAVVRPDFSAARATSWMSSSLASSRSGSVTSSVADSPSAGFEVSVGEAEPVSTAEASAIS